jgi:MFS family permease
MVVYTPIYLHQHVGLGWDQLGIIFTVMLLPFILFGILLGKLIDSYHVHKRTLLVIGTIIISVVTMSITFVVSTNVALWAFILFMTRLGAVTLETVSEVYFFTHVREEEAFILSIFRDMTPLAYIIAPLLGTLFLSFFPFKYLFLALGILMLTAFYYIKLLKHTKKFYESTTN